MKNIQISLTAKNYADALVQLGQDKTMPYEEILNNLSFIKDVCKNSIELEMILDNPAVSNENKFSIIDEIFNGRINSKIIEFLKILIEKKRFKEFDGIIAAFSNEVDKINNMQRVEVTSAIALNDEHKKMLPMTFAGDGQHVTIQNTNTTKRDSIIKRFLVPSLHEPLS